MKKMDKPRECGCKGSRTCLICEKNYGLSAKTFFKDQNKESFIFCPYCNKTWMGWKVKDIENHPYHSGDIFPFNGVYIKLNFLTEAEENLLLEGIDNMIWEPSQSGRRKQNFGPKCNFKKRKLKLGNFNGFPKFSQFVQNKFKEIPILEDFQTVEQCSLEYNPNRGASIDPHVDDCWIWGERIVTVNLLADSVLTMNYNTKTDHYNLSYVQTYPSVLTEDEERNITNKSYKLQKMFEVDWPVVRIPMPRRSLLVLYGAARYEWEHQVLRQDITARRVCIAYREFTPDYLVGGSRYNEGKDILEAAQNFF